MNEKEFCQKRISEQIKYLVALHLRSLEGTIDEVRYKELQDSAVFQLKIFENRWQELNTRETYARLADTANFIG